MLILKTCFVGKFCCKLVAFLHFFSFSVLKPLKIKISTSVWSARFPKRWWKYTTNGHGALVLGWKIPFYIFINTNGRLFSHFSLWQSQTNSAARKVDIKIANFLLKVAQKVATLKNWFKTSLKPA